MGHTDAMATDIHTLPTWTIGDRVRKARQFAGMSRPQLADAIGVSEAHDRQLRGEPLHEVGGVGGAGAGGDGSHVGLETPDAPATR